MIFGIDFDGTIVEEKFPEIGKPIEKVVEWLKAHGLNADAVNDNLPERIEMWGNNPRKIYADFYIDDHNAGGVILPEIEERS